MKARSFFYVCAGVLMIVVAYTIGATKAHTQAGSTTAEIGHRNTIDSQSSPERRWMLGDSQCPALIGLLVR